MQPNNCNITELAVLIHIYNKHHKNTNAHVISPRHFFVNIFNHKTELFFNFFLQLLVFLCRERLHTVNLGSNILSQYEFSKDIQETFKTKWRHCQTYISGSLKVTLNFKTHVKVC